MAKANGDYREPMFNLPGSVLALALILAAAYAAQLFLMPPQLRDALVLAGEDLRQGRYLGLVGYIFLHAGLTHLMLNVAGLIAFGPPVQRLLGPRNTDIALFFLFFLICGVLSGAGHALLPWNADHAAVGASGAISGLFGAASRLLGRRGAIAPLGDRTVLGQALAFLIINLIIGFAAPLAGINIAWEAHVIGYALGLLLIWPMARLARRV